MLRGRRPHAGDHERVLGRRHGPHAVHAVGILHAGLRPRRRRPQGHLGLGADALASAANQLRDKGWVPDQSWGYEVRLPPSVDVPVEGPDQRKPVREWIEARRDARGGATFPADALDAQAFILTPAGAYGPAFLALENFLVIKRYNMSDLYAMFVGNLARPHRRRRRVSTRPGAMCASCLPRHRGDPAAAAGAAAMTSPRSTARPA